MVCQRRWVLNDVNNINLFAVMLVNKIIISTMHIMIFTYIENYQLHKTEDVTTETGHWIQAGPLITRWGLERLMTTYGNQQKPQNVKRIYGTGSSCWAQSSILILGWSVHLAYTMNTKTEVNEQKFDFSNKPRCALAKQLMQHLTKRYLMHIISNKLVHSKQRTWSNMQ